MKLIKYFLSLFIILNVTACGTVTYEEARAESKKAGAMIEELTWNKNGLQIPEKERRELESWWMRSNYAVNSVCEAKDFACVKKYYIELQNEMVAYRKKAVKKYGLRSKPKKEYASPEKINL